MTFYNDLTQTQAEDRKAGEIRCKVVSNHYMD